MKNWVHCTVFSMLVAVALAGSGCASLLNMELTKQERNAQILKASILQGGEPALMVNLMALGNITEAPTWRTVVCGLADLGTGLALYSVALDKGWIDGDDDGGTAQPQTINNYGVLSYNTGPGTSQASDTRGGEGGAGSSSQRGNSSP